MQKYNPALYWSTYLLGLTGIFSINRSMGDIFLIFLATFILTIGFLGSRIGIYKKYITNRYVIWTINIFIVLIVLRIFPFTPNAEFINRCLAVLILLNLINSFTIITARELAISQAISTILIIFAPALMMEGAFNIMLLLIPAFILWTFILNSSLRARLSKDCETILVIPETKRSFIKEISPAGAAIAFIIIAAIPMLFILIRFQLPLLLISPYFQSENFVDILTENQKAAMETDALVNRSKEGLYQSKWLLLPGNTGKIFLHSNLPGKGKFRNVEFFKNQELSGPSGENKTISAKGAPVITSKEDVVVQGQQVEHAISGTYGESQSVSSTSVGKGVVVQGQQVGQAMSGTYGENQSAGSPATKRRLSGQSYIQEKMANAAISEEKLEEGLDKIANFLWNSGRFLLLLLLLFIVLDYLLSKFREYMKDKYLRNMALNDPKSFITKAYSYICQSLSGSVSPRLSYMTAEEYSYAVKYNAAEIGPWFEIFTDKFQEAAYSNHAIQPEEALDIYSIYRSINHYLWQRKFTIAYISKIAKEKYNRFKPGFYRK